VPAGLDPSLAGTTLFVAGVTLGPPDHATPPVEIAIAE
jgi:hypothetical protein